MDQLTVRALNACNHKDLGRHRAKERVIFYGIDQRTRNGNHVRFLRTPGGLKLEDVVIEESEYEFRHLVGQEAIEHLESVRW